MLKRLPIAFCLTLVILTGCRQPDAAFTDRLLIGEVMMNSQFTENLRALAMPGGRLSGSDNGHKAEQYVADTLRSYGFDKVWLEPFSMPGWQVNSTEAVLLTDPPVTLENAVALRLTTSTPPEGVTAEVVSVGKGTEEDFKNAADKLNGRFALMTDPNGRRGQPMLWAREHGAVGVLFSGRPDREPIIGGCHDEPRPELPIAIRYDDAKRIEDLLNAGESVRINIKVQTELWDATPNNVIAEIPGSGPLAKEQVILCAHLDSWNLAEGAIDNGNGSSAILETARALKAVNWQPRRTVRFIWFMGEEQALNGSNAYVAAHQDELDRIVAVVNVDMPGSPRKFQTFGHPEIVDFLKSVRADLKAYEIDEEIGNASGGWSDHAPFAEAGVCALCLSGDLGPGVSTYHTLNDTYDKVDRRATVQSSSVFAVLIRRLADSGERPGKRLDHSEDKK